MIYVVGGRGFVGSAYVRLFERLGLPHRVVDRATYDGLRGTSCDVLINANGNSRKYMAMRDPVWDFDASVRSVAQTLVDFPCGRYVFLSSGDVYPEQTSPAVTDEGQVIDVPRVSRYGLHKHLAEQLVRGAHPRWLVMRMGGFVGPGLQKNAIFDMLTGSPVRLDPRSELQFISTDRAAELVWSLVQRDVLGEIVNLGATGLVQIGTLHRCIGSASAFEPGSPLIRYELGLDKLARFSGERLPSTTDEVERFVASWRAAEPSPRLS